MDNQPITVGQTKIVRYCAVGAICRAGDECFVPCDITRWKDRKGKPLGTPIPIVRQHLKIWLESKGFENVDLLQPPTLTNIDNKLIGNKIPAVRFPSWMVCLRCGRLHHFHQFPWRKNGKNVESVGELRCDGKSCNGKLDFVTWVLVSSEGFLDDLPWRYMSHWKLPAQKKCEFRDELYLKRNERGQLIIRCGKCKHEINIDGLRKETFFEKRTTYMRKQPWLQERVKLENKPPVALNITDVRIHLPDIASALDIPPESRIDENDIRARLRQHEDYNILKELVDNGNGIYEYKIKNIARTLGCSREKIKDALDDLQKGWPRKETSTNSVINDEKGMLVAEYKAICRKYKDFKEYERFITDHQTSKWNEYLENLKSSQVLGSRYYRIGKAVKKLIIVNRLREIQVFCGFSRIFDHGQINKPCLEEETEWLPACELYGEGIFFSLDETKLQKWESYPLCVERAKIIEQRRKQSTFSKLPKATPRFILLHTIAHLIIRELEFSSGYPVSSIKERIFCSNKKDYPMSGILIYVAVPNKMGSLGGLADHGKPDKFFKLWIKALEKAEQCTYDPICAEHEGQGPDQLNRAACHGCALLPEVSCIYQNCLLDRQFLIGNGDNHLHGFVSYMKNSP